MRRGPLTFVLILAFGAGLCNSAFALLAAEWPTSRGVVQYRASDDLREPGAFALEKKPNFKPLPTEDRAPAEDLIQLAERLLPQRLFAAPWEPRELAGFRIRVYERPPPRR